MFRKYLLLGVSILSNLWIWRLFNFNYTIGAIIIITTILLWLTVQKNTKKYFLLTSLFFILLLYFQLITTKVNTYTFSAITGFNWSSVKLFLLSCFESINKLITNFSEIFDLNLYFFANYPRGRFWYIEFEKFPYSLLPIFLIGIFQIKKSYIYSIILGLSPVTLLSIIGNNNPIGPFVLFPIISIIIYLGISYVVNNRKFIIPFIIFYILTVIQAIAYAKY